MMECRKERKSYFLIRLKKGLPHFIIIHIIFLLVSAKRMSVHTTEKEKKRGALGTTQVEKQRHTRKKDRKVEKYTQLKHKSERYHRHHHHTCNIT